jgi:hypothetical protein
MANLTFRFLANDAGLKKGIANSKKQLSGFESAAQKAGAGIKKALGGAALVAGVATLARGLADATKAAAEDLKSQKLLARQLTTTTKATTKQVAGAEKWVNSLSNATGVLDDDIRPALSNAVRGTGSLEKAQNLVSIALDGSVASGKPLNTVLQALIKASNGQTQSLYKLAPELRATKGGLDEYAASVKGAAEASADPFAKFNVAVENLTEQFGMMLLPYVNEFVTYLNDQVVPAVSKFLDDVDNPETDTGKVFIVLQQVMVGKDGKGGIMGAVEDVTESIGLLFASLSKDGNQLDGFTRTMEILGLSIEYAVKQMQNLIFLTTNPLKLIDVTVAGIDFSSRVAEVMNRPSLFGSGAGNINRGGTRMPDGTILPGVVETQSRSGARVFNININRANMSPNDVVTAIRQYERNSGVKVG